MDISGRLKPTDQTSPGGNRLVAALSAEAFSLLAPHLRNREFDMGSVLWEPGEAERQIYFPHSGLISLTVAGLQSHVEFANVSRQGAAGFSEPAEERLATSALVLIGGTFAYLPTHQFVELEKQNSELKALADFSRRWILLQSQHMAACNAIHSAEARFCRWLLLAADGTENDTVSVTQEDIAGRLGIRRTTVTLIAQKIQSTGAIRYSRGKIIIRDRAPLLSMTCSCYHALDANGWPSHRLAESTAARMPLMAESA
jgi:CRP-like cAMP-binding protein